MKSRAFRVGVIGGIILFTLLNLFVYAMPADRFHGGTNIGFPLLVYQEWFTSPVDIKNPEASHGEIYLLEHIPINFLLIFFSILGIGLSTDVATRIFRRKGKGSPDLK